MTRYRKSWKSKKNINENNENHENHKIPIDNKKIMKILEFQ